MTKNEEYEDGFMEIPSGPFDLVWVKEITPPTAEKFVNELFTLNRKNPGTPIVIYIDSPGGYVDSLMTMLSAMEAVSNPLITVAMGQAASCGAVLLSHGSMRFASNYSRIMIHEAAGGGIGNVHDAKNQIDELEYANFRAIDLLAKNCSQTVEFIENLISHKRRDVYMSAQEALKIGLIDKVGTPTLSRVEDWQISIQVPSKKASSVIKKEATVLPKKKKTAKK